VKSQTYQRVSTPTAILIGLPDGAAELCTDVLSRAGLRVLRAAHAAGAAERIPVVLARIVVLSSATTEADVELLNDRCVAVGAEMITVTLTEDGGAEHREELAIQLRQAASNALMKAMRDG
jgi:hypothetical protein